MVSALVPVRAGLVLPGPLPAGSALTLASPPPQVVFEALHNLEPRGYVVGWIIAISLLVGILIFLLLAVLLWKVSLRPTDRPTDRGGPTSGRSLCLAG